jgi:hypothetical protein
MIKANEEVYFGKEVYMFRTDLLSINKSTTAIGICHTSYVVCRLADRQHN